MALSSSAIEGAIKSTLPFVRNEHYKGDVMVEAVAKAVFDVFTGSALINVPAKAGSTYAIEGVSSAALESAINGYLTINISGEHAKAGLLSKAVAVAIASVISNATVSVPSETVGNFPVDGFGSGSIESLIQSTLESHGINTTSAYSRVMDMVSAIAQGVANTVSADAVYLCDGVAGGAFLMS